MASDESNDSDKEEKGTEEAKSSSDQEGPLPPSAIKMKSFLETFRFPKPEPEKAAANQQPGAPQQQPPQPQTAPAQQQVQPVPPVQEAQPASPKGSEVMGPMGGATESDQFATVETLFRAISQSTTTVLRMQFSKLMSVDSVQTLSQDGLLEYIYAAGLLSYAGKEINRDNLSRLMDAIGIVPSDGMIKVLKDNNVESHVIYVYAFYFLIAVGVNPTTSSMMDVVRALGMEPKMETASEMLRLCKDIVMQM